MLTTITGLTAQDQSAALTTLMKSGEVRDMWREAGRRSTQVFFLAENETFVSDFFERQKK